MTLQIFLLRDLCYSDAQSRQSAKLFLQSLELGSPTPLAAGECAPPPFGPGGEGHTRLRVSGWRTTTGEKA